MKTALIFNIQKFSVHDGPGIRTTVFFKGCPLSCQWCHNPESQDYQRELLISPEKCTHCGVCETRCLSKANKVTPTALAYDAELCSLCETCVDYCVNNAREIAGKTYTLNELMKEIEKDRPFYEQSGGGVTLSGGEVISQIDFAEELARTCQERGISVVLDTCGFGPSESFVRIAPYIDIFLYDLKLIDRHLHRQYTGQDNAIILSNLQKLASVNANIALRLPLIEGINADDANIQAMIDFCTGMPVSIVNLLPYHAIGKGKYRKLGKLYQDYSFHPPSEERLAEIKALFENAGYKVKIGG